MPREFPNDLEAFAELVRDFYIEHTQTDISTLGNKDLFGRFCGVVEAKCRLLYRDDLGWDENSPEYTTSKERLLEMDEVLRGEIILRRELYGTHFVKQYGDMI